MEIPDHPIALHPADDLPKLTITPTLVANLAKLTELGIFSESGTLPPSTVINISVHLPQSHWTTYEDLKPDNLQPKDIWDHPDGHLQTFTVSDIPKTGIMCNLTLFCKRPDEQPVARHPDTVIIEAAGTWGTPDPQLEPTLPVLNAERVTSEAATETSGAPPTTPGCETPAPITGDVRDYINGSDIEPDALRKYFAPLVDSCERHIRNTLHVNLDDYELLTGWYQNYSFGIYWLRKGSDVGDDEIEADGTVNLDGTVDLSNAEFHV